MTPGVTILICPGDKAELIRRLCQISHGIDLCLVLLPQNRSERIRFTTGVAHDKHLRARTLDITEDISCLSFRSTIYTKISADFEIRFLNSSVESYLKKKTHSAVQKTRLTN
jgi:hypothetical protein